MIRKFFDFLNVFSRHHSKLCIIALLSLGLFVLIQGDLYAQRGEGTMEVAETDEETGRPIRFNFNFTSQELKNLFEWLSRETDLTIIASENDIQGKRFSLINLNNVTLDEVIEKVKTVLAQYNLTFVMVDSTLLVTTFEKAKVMNVPVKIIEANPELVEMTDEIQTYIIQLINASASEQANVLRPLLNNQASIFADAITNALVITDVSSNIRRIVSILQFADEGERFPLKVAIVPLTYANASDLEDTLSSVFDQDDDEKKTQEGTTEIDAEQVREALEQGLGVDLIDGTVKIIADENSNSLILKATEENLIILREIIRHLDIGSTLQTEIRTYRLQYASAEEVVNTLEEIITGEGLRGDGRRSVDREDILELLTYRRNEVNVDDIFHGFVGLVNISRNDRLNIVVVSSDPRNFPTIEELIEVLDQAKTQEEIKMYFLEFANAETLATLLRDLFEGGSGGSERERPWWDWDRGNDSSDGSGFGVQGAVHIVHDIRLNALLISTSTQNFALIDDLIKKLDVSMPEQEWGTKIYYLRYADAENVANLLNSHFGGNAGSSSGGFRGDDFWWLRSRGSSSSAQTQGSLAGNVSAAPFVNLNAVIISTGTQRNFEMIEEFIKQIDVPTPEEQREITETIRLEYAIAESIAQLLSQVWQDPQAENQGGGGFGFGRFFSQAFTGDEPVDVNSLFGKVTVYADSDTNSLIVTTRSRYMDQVRALIKQLDFVRGQVRIDIQILEITLDETTKQGIETALFERRLGGLELSPDNPLVGDANSELGLEQEISGFNYSLATQEYMALLHTLIRENKVRTLSSPTIMTRDSRPATWSSGRRIPYLQSVDTNSILGETATQPLFNYDFIDPPVGINIALTPFIAKSQAGEDGKRTIGLDITNISASSFIEFTEFNAPITDDNSLSVYIDVEDGQQIVVGGIIRKTQKEVESKVPILGDIPLLGRLFKSTQTEIQDTEIVFIITPHIIDIKNPDDMEKLKQKDEDWLKSGKSNLQDSIK